MSDKEDELEIDIETLTEEELREFLKESLGPDFMNYISNVQSIPLDLPDDATDEEIEAALADFINTLETNNPDVDIKVHRMSLEDFSNTFGFDPSKKLDFDPEITNDLSIANYHPNGSNKKH